MPVVFLVLSFFALIVAAAALFQSFRKLARVPGSDSDADGQVFDAERSSLTDQKNALLRTLRDIEYEHSVGKISDEDFRELDLRHRTRAKELLVMLDALSKPFMGEAAALLAQTPSAEAPIEPRLEVPEELSNAEEPANAEATSKGEPS